jgi:hypothetical protein
MGRKPIGTSSTRLLIPLAMVALTGFGLSVASAQPSSQSPTIRPANARSAVATSGSGQYYFEFRSRQAWDYGHTFVVFGRVGELPSKNNVAGLSPKGDDPSMWVMAQDQYRASGSRRRACQRECEGNEQSDPGWPRDDR